MQQDIQKNATEMLSWLGHALQLKNRLREVQYKFPQYNNTD